MQNQQQCIFCGIANGKVPSKKVYEDEKVTAVLDINPAAPGHILILTKEHIAVMPQMDDELISHIGVIAKQLSHAVLRALKVEGTSIFVANGAAAGQRAPHFMMHVIPRLKNDGVGLELVERQVGKDVMKQLFERLAPVVAKHLGSEPVAPPFETEKKVEEPESNEGDGGNSPVPRSSLDDITSLLTGDGK